MKTFVSNLSTGLFLTFLLFGAGLLAQPANDDLCNAVPLIVGAGCNGIPNGDNTGASIQNGEPNPSCFSGAINTVWYSFVGPASGRVKISTNYAIGTNMDTEIAMYALNSGQCTNLSGLSLIACKQDDNMAPVFFNSTIDEAPVVPGTTYYVAVSGWGNTQGSFCVTVDEVPSPVPAPPANDTLCNAIVLGVDSSCNGMSNGQNVNAFFEVGEPLGSCTSDNNTVWFSFVAPAAGAVEITTDVNVGGSNTVTDLTLFALPGGNCTNLSDLFEIACARGNGTNGSTIDTTRVIPGDTYYVAVSGGSGSFCIEVSSAGGIVYPVNDNLCDAISLTVGAPCQGNFDNTNATLEIGEPTGSCFVGGANSVWFSFVGPSTGAVSITTDIDSMGTNDDTEMSVYALPGGNCSNLSDLVELECSQDNGSTLQFNAFIEGVPVDAGVTYYVQVSGYNGTEGTFCIAVEEAFLPSNDKVCDAIAIPVDGMIYDYFNLSATTEPGEDTLVNIPVGDGEGNFAWFENSLRTTTWHSFVAPTSGSVRIDLCNGGAGTTDFDTQLAVFSGDTCDGFQNFSFIAGNDDDASGCTTTLNRFSSVLDVNCLTPGDSYFILVDGFLNQSGFYSISINEIQTGPIKLEFDTSNPTCANDLDGQIMVNVEGGAGPYSFSWNNGDSTMVIDSVGLGNFIVTVTDFCDSTAIGSVDLLPQPVLASNLITEDISCNGDSTGLGIILAGGGRSPYSYSWSTGDSSSIVSGLKAGNYSVTVTDVCDTTHTLNLSIVEPTTLIAFAGQDQYICDTPSTNIQLGVDPAAMGGSLQPLLPRAYGFALDQIFQQEVNLVDNNTQLTTSTQEFFAGDVDGNTFYLIGQDTSAGILFSFDIDSSKVNQVGSFFTPANQLWLGLSYDPSSSKLFAIRTGSLGSFLFEINTSTAQLDSIGELEIDIPLWLAIDNQGQMYSLDALSDQLLSINPTTLEVQELGNVGFDANFIQDADFDPETGLLYLAAFNDSTDMAEYRLIDLNLGAESAFLGEFPQGSAVQAFGIGRKGADIDLYSYEWSPALGLNDASLTQPSLTYVTDTTYVLTVMDYCGNVATDSVEVILNNSLSIDSVVVNGSTATANASGGIPPYTYNWSNGDTGRVVNNLVDGSGTVTVTDNVGCSRVSSFSVTVSNERSENFSSFSLYPNPNKGQFTLDYQLIRKEAFEMSIYSTDGKLVYQKSLKESLSGSESLKLESLPKGVYKLTLRSGVSFLSRSFVLR
ncbi:MAG: T9SS type A sorting domain-containing protein [Bacteroidia bacterium]|nr:T9SS type A sorting domain-containing protein [Bacteroidia bacterium]